MTPVNNQYKDRLFKFIFGNPKNKKWTLSLYNAVNGSNYTDENDITLNTIEDVVYMHMKNDVSFLINDTMNLYEQQSSFNPNMPLRFFIYGGMLYGKFARKFGNRIYSSALLKAPTPRCICFYNGPDDKEDRIVLKLSDSFKEGSKPDIEVTVLTININYGRNRELLDSCKPLNDYSWFVSKIIEKQKNNGGDLESAIDEALAEMSDDSVIKQFLLDNQEEVKQMCITEFNDELYAAQRLEEGIEIGREQGLKQGLEQGEINAKKVMAEKLFKKSWSVEEIAELLGVSVVDVDIWLNSK